VLKEALGGKGVRVIGDDRTNSLLVSANDSALDAVKKLLVTLDKEATREKFEHGLNIIRLRHIRADNLLESALKTVLGHGPVKIALDPTTNSVMLAGERSATDALAVLIERLDQPPRKEPAGREMQVRVVWLASGPRSDDVKEAPQPPADLKEVVAELAKIGVRDPILVSQAVVNAATNGNFEIQGSAHLAPAAPGHPPTPCSLTVSGEVIDKPGETPALQVNIAATGTTLRGLSAANRPTPICRIQTQIAAPLGHPVVLGVTPTDHTTSVFVVQLISKAAPAEPRR
jgi:hypothetical protein